MVRLKPGRPHDEPAAEHRGQHTLSQECKRGNRLNTRNTQHQDIAACSKTMTEEKSSLHRQKEPLAEAAGRNHKGQVRAQSEGRAGTVKKDDNHAAQVLKEANTEVIRQREGIGTVALVAARGGQAEEVLLGKQELLPLPRCPLGLKKQPPQARRQLVRGTSRELFDQPAPAAQQSQHEKAFSARHAGVVISKNIPGAPRISERTAKKDCQLHGYSGWRG